MSMEKETVNPEDGPCVRNLEDEVPLGSCSPINRNLEDEVPLGSSSPINRYSTPPPISSEQVNGSMEAYIPSESNDFTSGMKKHDLNIYPVSPLASGEGLPYAPVDWPNPGDTWGWKVGKRLNQSGFYVDRYLFLPTSLQNPSRRRQCFSSKPSFERYVQKVDPKIDIASVFESFSWRVPHKRGACSQSEMEVDQVVEKKIPQTFPRRKRKAAKLPVTTMYRRRTRQSTKWIPRVNADDIGIIDLCSLSKESETSDPTYRDSRSATELECDQVSSHQAPISPATDSEPDQVSSRQAPISPAGSFVAHSNSPVSCGMPQKEPPQGPENKEIPEDFDCFLDSLDDMLASPLPKGAVPPPATDNYQVFEDEIAEARRKLSSMLAMDFHLLVSKDFKEFALLSAKLQKDPSLSADQISKLKLIEEIPATGKDFLETKQIMEEVDKFFADLASKVDKANSLRNEFNASKEDIAMLQDDINSCLSNIEEIHVQISELQSREAELRTAIDIKNKEVTKLTATQKMVADSLPQVVHEVQLANSKKPEWERKQKNALKREAEILKKIAPLRGFSL